MVERTKHSPPTSYHRTIDIIAQKTSIRRDEIEKRINQTYKRLGKLASMNACAKIVAQQLGVEV